MKIKIFRTSEGFEKLEEQVNLWLVKQTRSEIISLHYQDNLEYASIVVLYHIHNVPQHKSLDSKPVEVSYRFD